MFVLPVLAALGLAGATTVCWRGVPTESGTSPGGRWRIRWACWRWLAEVQRDGGPWERVAAFRMGEQAFAKVAAMSAVATALPGGVIGPPMVRVITARRVV